MTDDTAAMAKNTKPKTSKIRTNTGVTSSRELQHAKRRRVKPHAPKNKRKPRNKYGESMAAEFGRIADHMAISFALGGLFRILFPFPPKDASSGPSGPVVDVNYSVVVPKGLPAPKAANTGQGKAATPVSQGRALSEGQE